MQFQAGRITGAAIGKPEIQASNHRQVSPLL
jgi:hypothetical protein